MLLLFVWIIRFVCQAPLQIRFNLIGTDIILVILVKVFEHWNEYHTENKNLAEVDADDIWHLISSYHFNNVKTIIPKCLYLQNGTKKTCTYSTKFSYINTIWTMK